MKKECLGEFIGTFTLVLFGCGTVGTAVFFNTFSSLFEVALLWGFGVMMAIFVSRKLSPAHLNPAVSVAMVLSSKLEKRKLFPYIGSQFLGAFVASILLFAMFGSAIEQFEAANNLVRGGIGSEKTAMMFGDFFPNPGYVDKVSVNWIQAFFLEALGTFMLLLVIFNVSDNVKNNDLPPILIGITITILICLIAPFTQAGFNPARDFGPRLFSYFAGWNKIAIPNFEVILVYVIGPIAGSSLSALIYNFVEKRKLNTI